MNTAVLGGSFNPVHKGHIHLAKETLKRGFQRVIFVPAAMAPHKAGLRGASDTDRLKMLALALDDIPGAVLWNGEIRRGGISYTIDTIRELKKTRWVEGKAGLIIGDDLVDDFSSWRESKCLLEEVQVIVARRIEGGGISFNFPCLRLDNPIWPFSSSGVRQRIESGRIPEEWLPPAVAEYIRRAELYGYRKI